ncbi:MAG: helix-turn-helix domain-containing protein [Chloroflexi bacterium]|nr:helix-turn-helix domain-containing protein [Chloroflexota bacterium]
MPPKPELYTVQQAADYLGVKPETIKYHVYVSEKLPAISYSPRLILFTREMLDGLAQEMGYQTGQSGPEKRRPGRPRRIKPDAQKEEIPTDDDV